MYNANLIACAYRSISVASYGHVQLIKLINVSLATLWSRRGEWKLGAGAQSWRRVIVLHLCFHSLTVMSRVVTICRTKDYMCSTRLFIYVCTNQFHRESCLYLNFKTITPYISCEPNCLKPWFSVNTLPECSTYVVVDIHTTHTTTVIYLIELDHTGTWELFTGINISYLSRQKIIILLN